MTDKDRSEEIKEYFGLWIKNDISHDWCLSSETIDNLKYLIEQTERVKQLEETVEDYKAVNKELHQRGRKVRKQNKRYREALEFYADEDNYKTTGEKTYIGHGDYTEEIWIPVDVDSGKKARQALDGEE